MKKMRYPALAAALLLLASCATIVPGGEAGHAATASRAQGRDSAGLSSVQRDLVEGAEHFARTGRLNARGRSFRKDCTGTVMAIYWYAGIDLVSPLSRYSGNGVRRLYKYFNDLNLLYTPELPAPGDIVFWDDTYDRNKDGQVNDPFTHAGVVVAVKDDGTVEYVHHNYRRGIVIERMNLYRPHVYAVKRNGKRVIINSPMRMKGSPKYDKTLASELVRSFGKGYHIPREIARIR